MKDALSAVQQAQKMFQKLVNAKLNSAPMPKALERTFPVATLADGQVLLSNGQTKISFPQKRVDQIQKSNFNQMKPPAQTQQQVNNVNMEITTPARELALGGPSGQNFFVNLLSQVLKPQLKGTPEIGPLTALLPSLQDKLSPVDQTSALANLPQLAPETKSVFDDNAGFYRKFLSNTGSIQQQLAKDFLTNYTRGEQPVVNNGTMQRAVPIISNYQNRFGIPSSQSAQYAQISSNANQFNQRI